MSSCEKCWQDAHSSPDECVPDEYAHLMLERKENPCSAEEQAGPYARVCPDCKRSTLHQHTGEPMCGCTKGDKDGNDD